MAKRSMTCLVASVALLLGLASAADVRAAEYVGQVATQDLRVEGLTAPSGTALVSPSLVASGAQPGLLYLRSGRSLALAPRTELSLQAVGEHGVRVAVHTGAAAYRTAAGEVLMVDSASSVVLDQEGEIGEGLAAGGVVGTLIAAAAAGDSGLTAETSARIDSGRKILVKSPDGTIQEVHCIESIDGSAVNLADPLAIGFPVGSLLIQGGEVQQALDSGDAVDRCKEGPLLAGLSPAEFVGRIFGSAIGAFVVHEILEEEVSPRLP